MSTTITDVTELQAMENDLTEDYVLGNDIDAAATSGWNANNGFIPIGFYGTPFTGTFDGAGYTISDLYINRATSDIGLFSSVQTTTIQDVTLSDVDITSFEADKAGALIGESLGATVTGCHSSGSVSGRDYTGGLIGYADNSGDTPTTVEDCSSSCTISSVNYGGGLIGITNPGNITDSYATGAVTISGANPDDAGGFTGALLNSSLVRCYATGNVTGDDEIGGLIGWFYGTSTITNCYARGDVSGDDDVGGLIGYLSGGTATNCYSTGAVTGNTDVGGLVGVNSDTVTNCFWDTETSGQATSDGGTGKTTAQMIALATFYSLWDIDQTATDRNNGYPFLSWEIDESNTTWLIYGEGLYPSPWDFPDLLDDKGRPVKNANLDAYRTDIHSDKPIESQITDANGTASFSLLPVGQDVIFHAAWGGINNDENEEWFFLRVNELEDGGTGSGTATGALDNLGLGTSDSPQFAAINIGHASDTTLARVSGGTISVESKPLIRIAAQIIAANDSYIKTQADHICDGTDD